MNTTATPLNPQHEEAPRERPFIIELFSLIARVFATAIAINILFAAVVLLVAWLA